MRKMTGEIVLGGKTYTVRPFTIGELERIAEMQIELSATPLKFTFAVLRMALARAEPKVEDPNEIEATLADLNRAFLTVVDLAGLSREPTENPPQTAAAA